VPNTCGAPMNANDASAMSDGPNCPGFVLCPNGSQPCELCIESNCCDINNTTWSSPDYIHWYNCVYQQACTTQLICEGCPAAADSCAGDVGCCNTAYPAGAALEQELSSCVQTHCSATCCPGGRACM
jgi:hypothetical protein